MKRICGLTDAPAGLARFHADPATVKTWDEFGSFERGAARRELTDALLERQHGLCAYCEIRLDPNDKRVEHFVPRSDPAQGATLACDHRNLLVVCKGGSDKIFGPDSLAPDPNRFLPPVSRNISCDAAKADSSAAKFLDPRQIPAAPSLFQVNPDGRVESDPSACALHAVPRTDVEAHIAALRLNVERLRIQREAVWGELTIFYLDSALQPEGIKLELIYALAERRLLPRSDGLLAAFFSTTRSFFDPVAEIILAQPPQQWI
jgi:uncharacterized protein (TIGR02646 family)